MVLNSHHSLTASTTLASIVSAAVLTAVGLCIPYTERAAKNRAAPASSFNPGQPNQAAPTLPRGAGPAGTVDAGSPRRASAADAAQH